MLDHVPAARSSLGFPGPVPGRRPGRRAVRRRAPIVRGSARPAGAPGVVVSRAAGPGGHRGDAGDLSSVLGSELLEALDRVEIARGDRTSASRRYPAGPAQDLALLLWLRRRHAAGEALAELDRLHGPALLEALEGLECAVDRVRWRDAASRTSETVQRLAQMQARRDASARLVVEVLVLVRDRARRTPSRRIRRPRDGPSDADRRGIGVSPPVPDRSGRIGRCRSTDRRRDGVLVGPVSGPTSAPGEPLARRPLRNPGSRPARGS